MYLKVSVDGTREEVDDLTLEEMQEFVGGYIEAHGEFIVNEMGLFMNLPRNKLFPQYVGNVIIDVEGR